MHKIIYDDKVYEPAEDGYGYVAFAAQCIGVTETIDLLAKEQARFAKQSKVVVDRHGREWGVDEYGDIVNVRTEKEAEHEDMTTIITGLFTGATSVEERWV